MPAVDRLEGVRGAEDACTDNRHPHGADHSEPSRPHRDHKVWRRGTTG
jgi:hypothetical protein